MGEAGWNLKKGEIYLNIDYKDAIVHFFSKGNIMKNLYKLLLFKAILEINGAKTDIFYRISINFSKLYFNYKVKYPINMTIYNGRSKKSSVDIEIEKIFQNKIFNYDEIPDNEKIDYICEIQKILKRNVIGAFYTSLKKIPYSFDIKSEEIVLNVKFKEFIDKNKNQLEEILELRIIEFLKVSEENREILSEALEKEGITNYKQDYYIQINNLIEEIFK